MNYNVKYHNIHPHSGIGTVYCDGIDITQNSKMLVGSLNNNYDLFHVIASILTI